MTGFLRTGAPQNGRGLLNPSPADRVKAPKVVYGRPEAYTREEVERIPAVCPRYRIGTLVTAALYTGARLGELLALRWSDVDLTTGVITFRRTLIEAGSQKDGRDPLFKESTKDNEIRDVPMAPELAEALRAWRRRWIEERMKVGGGYFDHFDLVFPTATGRPMSPRTAQRDSGALLIAAGVRRLSPHKFRHTFATRLLDAGADVDVVAELLGDDPPDRQEALPRRSTRSEEGGGAGTRPVPRRGRQATRLVGRHRPGGRRRGHADVLTATTS